MRLISTAFSATSASLVLATIAAVSACTGNLGDEEKTTGDTDGGAPATQGTGGGGSGGSSSGAPSPGAGDASSTGSTVVTSGPAPAIGGCNVFPADNPWNTRIDDATKFPVHPMWSTYMGTMNVSTHLHPDWGAWSTDHYGIPWQTVPASQPGVAMKFSDADESDPGPYPFPSTAKIEGGANSGGDMHVLVVETGTCTLYETFDSKYVGPGWSCGSGAKFDLGSNALRTDGWTSADAAGLPILPGLVKVAEVQAGAVNHAIRFTVNRSQQACIHPAVHAAGDGDPSLPPMGLRLRLKASFDVSSFQGASKVVLTAMQQYGIILADNGSDWYISGDSDDAWTPLMDGLVTDLGKVHGSDFEAVETGPISTAGL
jgi:hypothetical protein